MATLLKNASNPNPPNLLINGAFDFFQRNVGPVATVLDSQQILGPDRWLTWHNSAGITNMSVERSTTNPSNKSSNWLLYKAQASTFGQGIHVAQRVEADNAKALFVEDTCSVSVLVKSTSMSQVQLILQYADSKNSFGGTAYTGKTTFYTSGFVDIPFDGTATLLTFENIPLHANAINGVQVEFQIRGSQTLAAIRDFYIAEAKLNAGKLAAEFSKAGNFIDTEMELCRRYYRQLGGGSSGYPIEGVTIVGNGATTLRMTFDALREMRVLPTISTDGASTVSITRYDNTTPISGFGGTLTGLTLSSDYRLLISGLTSVTSGAIYYFSGVSGGKIEANAEL